MFNNIPNIPGYPIHFTPEEQQLAKTFVSYWTDFAKYGDPNAGTVTLLPHTVILLPHTVILLPHTVTLLPHTWAETCTCSGQCNGLHALVLASLLKDSPHFLCIYCHTRRLWSKGGAKPMKWPVWDSDSRPNLRLNTTLGTESSKDLCEFWDKIGYDY